MYIRHTSNPQNETNDCAIRSFANAEGKEWKEVAKEIFDMALEQYRMPNDFFVICDYADKHGYEEGYVYQDSPITVGQFVAQHPTGEYVLLLEDHALSVINGDYYDLVDCANANIKQYWTISE